MTNEQLRMTAPVWSEEVDSGGMFPEHLTVHKDPDEGPLRFLAVCRSGWGGGGQARRASLEEAQEHAWKLHKQMFGSS